MDKSDIGSQKGNEQGVHVYQEPLLLRSILLEDIFRGILGRVWRKTILQ